MSIFVFCVQKLLKGVKYNEGSNRRQESAQDKKNSEGMPDSAVKGKKIQDITVRELTEMADLNRGTFYLHYKDVFDLLEQTEEELLTAFRQLLNRLNSKNTDNELVPVFEEIFSMVKENGDLVEILLGETAI